MRRVRVLGVGPDDKPLLQHRREAVPVEVNLALYPDRLAQREGVVFAHAQADKTLSDSPTDRS